MEWIDKNNFKSSGNSLERGGREICIHRSIYYYHCCIRVSRGRKNSGLFTFVRAFKRDTRTNSISDRSYHFCIERKSWTRKPVWRFRPTTLKILRAREFYSLLSLRGISRSTRFPGKNNFPSARVSNINTSWYARSGGGGRVAKKTLLPR